MELTDGSVGDALDLVSVAEGADYEEAEEFLEIGDVDPLDLVEALSQIYQSAGTIDTEASEIIED